jgi:hypothetical protein
MANPNRPIQKGDICKVISGLSRSKSPNIGKTVTVGERQYGTHGADSRFGPVVRCEGDGIVQFGEGGGYVVKGWADFPVAWLERIDPDNPPAAMKATKKAVTT